MSTLKFHKPGILLLTQGVQPHLTAEKFPVLVEGFPRDEDLDREAIREGWLDGCLCRRCFLHDDPGGCLRLEA